MGDPDEDDDDEDDDEDEEEAAPAKVSQRPGPSRPRGHDRLQKGAMFYKSGFVENN